MKRFAVLAPILAMASCATGPDRADPVSAAAPAFRFAYAPAPAAQAMTGVSLPVGKCINISNTFEAPREGAWGRPITRKDFTFVREAGFTSIRLPVRWSAHASETAPYTIDPAFTKRIHQVVDMATASGLNVILNVHHYEGLFAAPDANSERFAALWRQIAASFASAPSSVWFELINEPHAKLDNRNLVRVLSPALAAVRETNPTRPVLIGGQDWSSIESLATLELPDDAYVVPTFHYYEPFGFTHQGAGWVNPSPPLGRAYGSPEDKARLDRDLDKARAYMARTGRVPVIGEYGANWRPARGDAPGVPVADRIAYYGTISAAWASIGLQSCAWGYESGFPLRNRDGWFPGHIEAISTTTTPR